ncbi:MFS general substrate transporter [Xylariomycetidae sp. FL0641]|nr:MFS general substrate transporter [Xylariomycetidae sp. FL0641]
MDEWFVKRKGFAYGIMWSGTGLAGVVLPLLMEHLLARYGFRTTLRLWAGLLFGLTAPLAWFVKPRLPASGATRARPFPDLRFARRAPFLLYQAANVAEAAGFFLPGLYLPGYARAAMGAGPLAAAATVLALNVASVAGCVAMGALVDRLHVTTCILASTAGATAACLLLWGLAPALPGLYAFAVLYGLFAGSFTSAWPGIMSEVARKGQDDHHHHHHHHHHHNSNNSSSSNGAGDGSAGYTCDPSMVFGLLAAGRGVGNVVSGPLSESLVKGLPWQGSTGAYGYGSGYGGLIVFTGVTALLGGASFVWRRLGLL